MKYAENSGVELEFTPIGKEAFVFFVNSKNPFENITVDQIKDIYSGRTSKWSQLGVPGLGKIKAYQRNEGSGSQSALIRLMDGTPACGADAGGCIRRYGRYYTKSCCL